MTWHSALFSENPGGAEGDRTPDLDIANVALSQLSYCPESGGDYVGRAAPLSRLSAGWRHWQATSGRALSRFALMRQACTPQCPPLP
jgi:hypothetical protein